MFSRWPIQVKLLIGLGLLVAVVVTLASSGLVATYSYRSLAKDLSWRAAELPLTAELFANVAELRNTVSELRGGRSIHFSQPGLDRMPFQVRMLRDQFAAQLCEVDADLADYRRQLEHRLLAGSQISDCQAEYDTMHKIEAELVAIHRSAANEDWMFDNLKVDRLDAQLEALQRLAGVLPSHLHRRLSGLSDQVRGEYRGLIVIEWITTVTSAVIFFLFIKLSYDWIVVPLRALIGGSRRVAAGEFNYRLRVESEDEMAELAEAMNRMTARFQAIRDDLDRQVQERTKQVVRSEQLASVGFLAAGVAHEINNPLASIAMCAESLEGRAAEWFDPENPDQAVAVHYLKMIQDEAFRCKEITEKLLDFSRIGETRRQQTDLTQLAADVIEMLRHLGKYQQKKIELHAPRPVLAWVNGREIKQVVLNLLTNALDCVEENGAVWIDVTSAEGQAELTVSDNGCGMPPEVLEHVFEPFFTRRKAGQGTGLGLSISYRIVADHGGTLVAASDGPGRGASFRVHLPLVCQQEISHQYQAA